MHAMTSPLEIQTHDHNIVRLDTPQLHLGMSPFFPGWAEELLIMLDAIRPNLRNAVVKVPTVTCWMFLRGKAGDRRAFSRPPYSAPTKRVAGHLYTLYFVRRG